MKPPDHVREFVREQSVSTAGLGCVLSRSEDDVLPQRERLCVEGRWPRHLPPLPQRIELSTLASPTLNPLATEQIPQEIAGRPGRGFAGLDRQAVGPCRKATRRTQPTLNRAPATLLIWSGPVLQRNSSFLETYS